jgi:hypothetical protein
MAVDRGVNICFICDINMLDALATLAEKEDLSRGGLVVRLLAEALEARGYVLKRASEYRGKTDANNIPRRTGWMENLEK